MTSPPTEYLSIPLNKGQVTLVSAHRYEELNGYKWKAGWAKQTNSYYAYRTVGCGNHKTKKYHLARVILGLDFGDKRTADHRNHDTLDNRDDNLRVATMVQQGQNRRKRRNKRTLYKGVTQIPGYERYVARIRVDTKLIYLGASPTQEGAYALYCVAAVKYHGEFARLE